ncbi:hypothetical protein [Salaquimonas pukyongi]|uniref:hypothetical protein n=1 Tax=Salaquimonas pukyongi TaxID=2712698 RepID=UPI0012EBA5E3|nr:hypothetical protein [Salaquimonas pukyongi]
MPFKHMVSFAAALLLVAVLASGEAMAAPKKVYLVNGLFSKAFGYGLTNLSKKIPYARHFKFSGSVSQAAINGIISDATKAYKRDPSTQISLVGISQGANAVANIASQLARNGVKVHYLAAIEGGNMAAVQNNVKKADSFICSNSGCTRKKLRRAGGNSSTRMGAVELDTGHIDSGNHPRMHRRVISQINSG